MGYECWVDSNVEIIHFEGMSCKSLSMTQAATKPAAYMGEIIHFSDGKLWKQIYVRPIMMFLVLCQSAFHGVVYFLGKETYHKILPLICGCKGTYLLNNVQYLKIMKFAIVICYDL